MFSGTGSIDFLPAILQRTHETVLGFARDMKVRAGEYLDDETKTLGELQVATFARILRLYAPWNLERDRSKPKQVLTIVGGYDGSEIRTRHGRSAGRGDLPVPKAGTSK